MPTHFVRMLNERESLVRAMKMVPVECVVRNVCAGSMAKRYGIEEGTRLAEPIFEFFLKSDALHDPLCNDDHIRVLGWATADEIARDAGADAQGQRGAEAAVRERRHRPRRLQARVRPSDSTIRSGPLVLGDEFTPDGCRLWDARTGEKIDKDRFRRDLGEVIEHYREVARRIGAPL